MLRCAGKMLAAAAAATAAATSTAAAQGAAPSAPASPMRYFTPTRLLPKFEIFDVRDNPAQGTMTRVSVDGKQLLVSQYPQLGPRKVDPNDLSPQFDSERRISVRLRHKDLAALVSVIEQRMENHHMQNNAFDLTFERAEKGYLLKGLVHRVASTRQEEWAIHFDNQFAVMLEHFLQAALTESFGFQAFFDSQARTNGPSQQQQQQRNGGNNGRGRRQRNFNNNSNNNSNV